MAKQTVYENRMGTPTTDVASPSPTNPTMQSSLPETDKVALRENMMNVLNGMRPGADGITATTANTPLQVSGFGDTTSPNGKLPEGNVSMDQIMGLMNKR